MLNLGMSEILLFVIIAVIVLGPEKLPVALRAAAKWYVKIKKFISNVQHDIEKELNIAELREQMRDEIKRFEDLEQQMQEKLAEFEKKQNDLLRQQAKSIHYQKVDRVFITPYRTGFKPFDTPAINSISSPNQPTLDKPLKVAV